LADLRSKNCLEPVIPGLDNVWFSQTYSASV
jgi:hypothetical protein